MTSLTCLHDWVAQANHIFTRLGITSKLEGYFIVDSIFLLQEISARIEEPPEGYLFLCPLSDLQPSPGSFQCPDFPVYWSLDATGSERLTPEKATELGFPSIEFTIQVRGVTWDEGVYAGVRKFQRGKGFDPDSQEVARHLRLSLYALSDEVETPFAHFDEDNGQYLPTDGEESTPDSIVADHDFMVKSADEVENGHGVGASEYKHHKGAENNEKTSPGCVDNEYWQAEFSQAMSQPWQLLQLVKASLILFLIFSWLYGYT
ncbi:hypothetical protein DFH09DRAFT_377497 [Mycena vulgaris]|nr:hypothetical protein DFH09DRAFT_377497 [Mycena vulgaris]